MKRPTIPFAIASAGLLSFLFVARPAPLSAQCARCQVVFTDHSCEWGPFACPAYAECQSYGFYCVVSGDCRGCLTHFDPDGIGHPPDRGMTVTRSVLAGAAGVEVLRACGGIIVGVTYTPDTANTMRKQMSRLVV